MMRHILIMMMILGMPGSFAGTGDPIHDRVGVSWNESRRYRDEISGYEILQLTTTGFYNQGPTIHAGTAFTQDGRIVFASLRDGVSALMSGCPESGEITLHHVVGPLPRYNPASFRDTVWKEPTDYLEGIDLAASRQHRQAAFIVKNENVLKLIDLDTNRVRVLLPAAEDRRLTHPVFSNTGAQVAVPACSIRITRNAWWRRPENPIHYLLCGLDGQVEELFFHPWGQTHIFPHPVLDQWAVKCGKPPSGQPENHDAVSRKPSIFILDGDREPFPVLPRNAYKDIAHIQWNGRGDRLVYHGQALHGGNYVGVADKNGSPIWEYVFREWTPEKNGWNHVIADPAGDFIFDDGLSVAGQISALDYRQAGESGRPRVIPLARWENDWNGLPDQASHPHPAVSADGSKLVFYGCRNGAIHIYVIDLQAFRAQNP